MKNSEKIITEPTGVIYQLAAKRLSETTFPAKVNNPLPEKIVRSKIETASVKRHKK